MSGEVPTGSVAEVVQRLTEAFGQVHEANLAVQAMKERVEAARAMAGGALEGTGNQLALDGMEALALAGAELDGVQEAIAAGTAEAVGYVAGLGAVLEIPGA
ncbi:MAG TPA: hypothetical protein VLH86_02515 [Patescibacteria group bacterium]|nr:hypothetical protein [Patescibacteria group bacterium]